MNSKVAGDVAEQIARTIDKRWKDYPVIKKLLKERKFSYNGEYNESFTEMLKDSKQEYDILEELVQKKGFQKLIPSRDELENTIRMKEARGKNIHFMRKFYDKDATFSNVNSDLFSIKKELKQTLDLYKEGKLAFDIDFSERDLEKLERISKNMTQKNAEKGLDILGNMQKDHEIWQRHISELKNQWSAVQETAVTTDIHGAAYMHPFDYAVNFPLAYFTSPDSKTNRMRVATTAIAGTGVSIAARYASGGTLTRDSKSNQDIAGIPFI